MFSNISWIQFWSTVLLVSTGYYLVICRYCFKEKQKVSNLLSKDQWSRGENPLAPFSVQPNPSLNQPVTLPSEREDDFDLTPPNSDEYPFYACLDEITAFLEEAKKRKGNKGEVIASIRQIVTKYPSIKDSEYKESLSNVIVSQCDHLCFIRLSAEDMDHVWNG